MLAGVAFEDSRLGLPGAELRVLSFMVSIESFCQLLIHSPQVDAAAPGRSSRLRRGRTFPTCWRALSTFHVAVWDSLGIGL